MPDEQLINHLFDEWAARIARGERPNPRDYLAQADDRSDELARLMDAYLRRAPRREPRDEDVALVRAAAAGDPPLLELRRRRGLRRDDVVDALMSALGLDPAKREKVKRCYHELENGLLDVRGVSQRVFDALRTPLGEGTRELAAWKPRSAAMQPTFLRLDAAFPAATAASLSPEEGISPFQEPDEVDQLFYFGFRSDDNR